MSSSRARSSNSVSLFPFLAVLVCAMGALIFLLIVTTQQIRSEAKARAVAKRQTRKASEEVRGPVMLKPDLPMSVRPAVIEPRLATTNPQSPLPPERILPIPALVDLGPAQSWPVLPPPPKIVPPPPESDPEPIWPAAIAQKPGIVDPNIRLRADYAKLEAARQAWLDEVGKKSQTVAKLKQQVDELTENLKRINSQIEGVAKDRLADREAERKLQEARIAMLGQLAKVNKEIEDAKTKAAGSPTKFQVVPFDGLTGTNYRPIIIECTAQGMRFLPEDVLLTEGDFDGFTLGKNPLLAGAKALSDYWSKVSLQSGGKEPGPYVLLIVRPSGAKYYPARQMLEALDRPYGYELVEENFPLDIPPRDPVAAELCRRAVAEVLKDREDLKKLLVTHGPELLSRNPNYRVNRKPGGGFEVEYAPDGKFAEDGFGPNQGRNPFGDFPGGRFGQPGQTGPNHPAGNGASLQPGIVEAPAPSLVSQIPSFPGNMTPGGGHPPNPDSGYPALGQINSGTGKGQGTDNPGEPRLLPEDIIRRSQGQRPYEGNNGSDPGMQNQANAGEFGTPITNLGNGNLQQPSTNPPGSPSTAAQESSNPGQSTVQENVTNLAPQPDSENQANPNQPSNITGQPGQPGQATNQNVTNIPQKNPSEPATPGTQGNTGNPQPGGTPGAPSNGQPSAGGPSNPFEPAMPDFLKLNSGRMLKQAEPYQRRWGLSDPRASIGFEREVTVRVEPARLVVANAFAVAYDARTTKDQLSAGMLEAIERTARSWGRPPISFYWVPTIHFQVGNNEVPVYRHLTATAKAWGLETSAEGIEN